MYAYLPTFTIKINQMKVNITIHGSFGIGYHDNLRPGSSSRDKKDFAKRLKEVEALESYATLVSAESYYGG